MSEDQTYFLGQNTRHGELSSTSWVSSVGWAPCLVRWIHHYRSFSRVCAWNSLGLQSYLLRMSLGRHSPGPPTFSLRRLDLARRSRPRVRGLLGCRGPPVRCFQYPNTIAICQESPGVGLVLKSTSGCDGRGTRSSLGLNHPDAVNMPVPHKRSCLGPFHVIRSFSEESHTLFGNQIPKTSF